MQTQLIKVSKLKNNNGQIEGLPKNPRVLKDDKFLKLKKSLEDDPEMLELREVIAYDNNGELVVICGNMRLRALKELGIKEVPTKILPNETSVEKLKAYTIKDNVSFGEHDFDLLANEWEVDQLEAWGLNVPNWSAGMDENNMKDEDVDIMEEFNAIGTMDGKQRVVFLFDGKEEAESYLNSLKVEFKKMSIAWQVDLSTQSI